MSLFHGTAWDFRHRIPLTFYPLLALCVLGVLLPPAFHLGPWAKLGVLLVFGFGLSLRLWAASFLTGDVVVDAKAHASQLVTVGPFALIRHPLYAGAGLMLLTFVIFLPPQISIPFYLYETFIALRLAHYEDELFSRQFGEEYKNYKKRTGLFISTFAGIAQLRQQNLWVFRPLRPALLSEFIFVLQGLVLVLALTLNDARLLYGGVLLVTLAGGVFLKRRARQARL